MIEYQTLTDMTKNRKKLLDSFYLLKLYNGTCKYLYHKIISTVVY